ncbi:energy transducer TonB [Flavobacterium sp.]|uniref:energy transducer TonB n=1 Tax=Flavobacterium sp. TaxID=239 RepID=UPI001B6A5720|nr:energy transducer TonB [Flavobacterium sp.]MBP6182358.1 energy transducer TonB [Flavobacterium sp.]
MKSILLALLFLFIPKLCISQVITANDDAVYLDSVFNMGSEKNFKYIRVVKDYKTPNKESYEVTDFYKSGKIAMSGTTSKKDKIIKTGTFVYYYENGNKKSIVNYKLDKKHGKYFEFYENGNKKEEGENILDDKKNKTDCRIDQFWNSNGVQKVTDGNGDYEESNDYLFATGKVKNGFKEGPWEGSHKKMEYTFSENYENQKLVSGFSTDKSKVTHNYTVLEKKPEPKFGMADFYKFIGKNYKTPNIQGLKGKVYLTFVVEKDGKIVEPKVLRDIGYGTGFEAIRVIMACEDFIPGEQRGIKVRCTYSLPISIQSAY